MNQALRKVICIVLLVFGVCVSQRAQQQATDTRKELWPEVDVFVPLNEKVRLFFLFNVSNAKETRDNLEGQVGAHIDYTVNRRLILRTGYRYGFSLTAEDPFEEHRLIVEQTLRQPLPLKILLSDRNRGDFRFVNGAFSFRYRNRVMLEREFQVRKRSITPYSSAEVYHDSRFDDWNRKRLTVGASVRLKRGLPLIDLIATRRQMFLEFYYTRQNDSRSQPHHVNAIGSTFTVYF